MTSRAWVKWVMLGLLALVLWPPARGFLFVNEAINSTVARQVLEGARLYADAADWKGPLGYLLYAAVLGPTHYSLVALHLLGLALVGVVLWCVAGLARRIGGREAAFPAAALALVFLAQTLGPSLEMDLIMAALAAAGYLALVSYLTSGERASRLLPALSGVLLVLAISVKQVALLDLAALVLACLWLTRQPALASRARRACLPLLLGVLAGAALVALLIARYSTFHDYLAWAWIIPSAGQHLSLADRLGTWSTLLTSMIPPVALIWALGLVGAVWVWREGRTVQGAEGSRRPATPPVLQGEGAGREIVSLWLLAGIFGLLAGGQALAYHMTQAAAPVAVLAALGLRGGLRAVPDRSWRRYFVAVVMVALALGLGEPLRGAAWRWRDRVFASQETEVSRVVGARLAAATGPEDRILVLSHNPAVLFWSGRRAASRYLVLEHYWSGALESNLPRFRPLLGPLAEPSQALLADVCRTRPRFILVPENDPLFQQESASPARRVWLQKLLRGYYLAGRDPLYSEYERDM